MMKRLLILSITLICVHTSAQKNWFSGNFVSNSQYYVDDKKTGDFNEDNRFRSNNYIKLDAILKNISFEIQIEGYAPQYLLNYSPNFDKKIGIATYFVNYKSDKLDIIMGYFYEQFGSGLTFRSWEDKQLGLNNSLRGGKVSYYPSQHVQITALYGKSRFGFSVSDGSVFGLNTELNITEALKIKNASLNLGLSLVNRSQKIENSAIGFNKNTYAFSGRVNYTKNNFYSSIEYVIKNKDALVEFEFVNTKNLSKGNALLINTGYSKKGFGIEATFRRLENMSFYSDRQVEGNIDNEQLVNYIPSLTKQHDYGLANIYVYQSQPRLTYSPFEKAGEIGSQIDMYYNLKKGSKLGGKYYTRLGINYSTWYGLNANFNTTNRTYNAKYLNFGEKYFSDLNFEINRKWSKKWTSIFTYINLFYNKKFLEETSGKVNAQVAVIDATYRFLPSKSLRFEAQHLWTNDDKKNWVAGTIELYLSSKLSFFALDLYNYGNVLKKIHYYNFGATYTKNSTRIALNYGRQRGGLLCFGGVCRFVPESTGFGLAINTSF